MELEQPSLSLYQTRSILNDYEILITKTCFWTILGFNSCSGIEKHKHSLVYGRHLIIVTLICMIHVGFSKGSTAV